MGQPQPEIATVTPKGRVIPVGNGTATIVARRGSVESSTTVQVEKMGEPAPVSFRRDVMPAAARRAATWVPATAPPPVRGFRLSLRGYLPDQDYFTLTREAAGLRINPLAAETSLILRKPLGELPHEGGSATGP